MTDPTTPGSDSEPRATPADSPSAADKPTTPDSPTTPDKPTPASSSETPAATPGATPSATPSATGATASSSTGAKSPTPSPSTPATSTTPTTTPPPASSTGGATAAPATGTRPGGSRWWLIPTLTFLVGLVLGGVVVGAMRGGSTSPTAEVAPSTSTVPTPSASGTALPATATVVVPAECLQVAQDSQALVDLTSQAASAARDLDAGKLSDIVRQIGEAQTTLRTHAQACRAVDASLTSGATPSTTLAPTTTASPTATTPAAATPTSAASS